MARAADMPLVMDPAAATARPEDMAVRAALVRRVDRRADLPIM